MPLDATLFLIGLTIVFGGRHIWKRIKKKREQRARLRETWGEEHFAERFWERIPAYHMRWREQTDAPALDDQTWADLDMDEVFECLDRTQSIVGQQYLYHLLRTPCHESTTLRERDALIRHFMEQPDTREQIQIALQPLEGKFSSYLVNLFFTKPPPPSRFAWLFKLSPFLVVGLLVAGIWQPALLFVAVLYLSMHLFIQHRFRDYVESWILPLRSLSAMVDTGKQLTGLASPLFTSSTERLKDATGRLKRLQQAVRYVARSESGDPLVDGFYGFLNMFFLLDVNALTASLGGLKRHADAIRHVYEVLGYLDSMISVASFRTGEALYCIPTFVKEPKHCVIQELAHPLLAEPVTNDLDFTNRSTLITGSNMAGKTTFIRSVGVNAVLAQTIYTCTARSYEASFFTIQSLINRQDDLLEGKSYFLTEVELIKRLLAASENETAHLFIIDEIFKGTNTTERIAASNAVLDYLNQSGHHLVLVSTHDLELLDLLGDGWAFYHFSEIIDADTLRFDYKMRPGPASTRNALRILRLAAYPEAVIKDAFATANRLSSSTTSI